MQYVGLLIVVLLVTAQKIIQKQWNIEAEQKNAQKPFFFLAISALASFIFFAVQSGFQWELRLDVFWHAVGFAVAYSAATIGMFLAIRWGNLSITMLLTSYSLLIPVFDGLLFLDEKTSYVGIAGIVCLLVSILLIADKTQKASFSLKWLLSIIAAFVGNGMCSALQKRQQIAFNGAYKAEYMMIALGLCFVVLVLAAAINRENIKPEFKKCCGYAAANGLSNAIVNLLVMVLTGSISSAIFFPTISAGGVVLGFILATVCYKEKLTKMQLLGYAIGVCAVVLLNT